MHPASLGSLSTPIVVHFVLAGAALLLGPIALRARKGSRLHRASGYLWIALLLASALSSLPIRDFSLPNLGGFRPIHALTLLTFASITSAVVAVLRRDITAHRRAMWSTSLGGCIGAGLFTLLPGRDLGDLLWQHASRLV